MDGLSNVMEIDPFLVSAPAMIALIFKAGIYLYARSSHTHNYQTRLYLLLLFALSIQNIAEVAHFFVLADGVLPTFEVIVYYSSTILAIALLFHLAIAVAWEQRLPTAARWVYRLGYAAAGALIILIVTGQSVIQGFEQISYTVTRIPGPLYGLFVMFTFGLCVAVIVSFVYGTFFQTSPRERAKNALLLAAVVPPILVGLSALALLHADVKWLNASVVLPLGITFFLTVTVYAIHQHRIFDIPFFIPWSKVRRRKTAFHEGIRKLIAEIADLPTSKQLVERLSSTLRCPVALIGSVTPAYAGNTAPRMAEIPVLFLREIDHISVAHEIAESRPDVYRTMKSHGVTAVVPFNPHSSDAAGWLLLGEPFANNVYSPLDFRMVEELFGRMSELFVDKFVALRSRLESASTEIMTLRTENTTLKSNLRTLQQTCLALQHDDLSRRYDSPAGDVARAAHDSDASLPLSITFLGRDKRVAGSLRGQFQDVKTYVGLSSRAFQKARQPEVLVCRIEADQLELASLLANWKTSTAVLLYGRQARAFANQHRDTLRGGLVAINDEDSPVATMPDQLRALINLQKRCYSLRNCDTPLIGASEWFRSYMQSLGVWSGFSEPALICYRDDVDQFMESVHYLHDHGGRAGDVIAIDVAHLANLSFEPGSQKHTVAVQYGEARTEDNRRLIELINTNQSGPIRLVIGSPIDKLDALPHDVKQATRGFSITMPELAQRVADIPSLIHYFTLQFNLQSPVRIWCGQDDIRAIAGSETLLTVAAVRRATYAKLASKSNHVNATQDITLTDETNLASEDRSLDELVSDFEARVIERTLDRCEGNKAKAARLLRMRANTLHYKLERYGLGDKGQRRR